DTFATSLDPQDTVRGFASLLVPDFANLCMVVLLDGSELRLADVRADDPKQEMVLRECLERNGLESIIPEERLMRVLRTGESEVIDPLSESLSLPTAADAAHRDLLRELALRSVLLVPVQGHHRNLGVLFLGICDSQRRFGAREVS